MGLDPEFEDYEAGIVCPVCETILFNDITPKYVEIEVAGIGECPIATDPAPNGVWLLTQAENSCTWRYSCPPYSFMWKLSVDRSQLSIWQGMWPWFIADLDEECIDSFENDLFECVGPLYGIGGTVKCRWGPTIGPQSSFIQWEVGEPCCICESRIFSGFTPKYAFAKVLGLKKCPFGILEPPDGEFSMTQVTPCEWQGIHGNFTFVWTLTGSLSRFLIHDQVGNRHFFAERNEVCKAFFANELMCFPLTDHAYDGGCSINWGPWGPRPED